MTENTLKTRIQEDMKDAMRAQDKARLSTIRMLMAAIKQREIDEQIKLDDIQVIVTIEKMIKQRRESIAQYQTANRTDLVQKEEAEVTLLQSYLPKPLTEVEVDELIKEAIDQTQASSIKEMGKVMAYLKPKVQGRVEMGSVSAKIKAILS